MTDAPTPEWAAAHILALKARLDALDRKIIDVDERAKEAIREGREAAASAAVRQNEWRATVNDVTSSKMEIAVAQTMFESLNERIDRATRLIDGMQGKSAGIGTSAAFVVSLLTLAGVVIVEIIRLSHP